MDATQKFELLRRFFEERTISVSSGEFNGNYGGVERFCVSDIFLLNSGLVQLVGEGVIDTSKWIEDAGVADGRFLALTAGIYDIPSIGVDKNQQKLDLAKDNFRLLREQGVLNGTPILVSHGDFAGELPYQKVGVRFEEIGTFFNYVADTTKLVAKITSQSPRGTIFLLEDYSREPYRGGIFAGLRAEGVISLREPLNPTTRGFYLHVYRK